MTSLGTSQWGLFCGPGGKQLVLCDDEPCGPLSARRTLGVVPRKLLLDEPRISRAFDSGEAPARTVVDYDGQEWALEFVPIISPRTSTLVGLFAGVFPAGGQPPSPPLVGSWEWEIETDGQGRPTPHRRTFWDRNLFGLYDVAPSVAEKTSGYWEVGVWQNELVAQSDQMRLFTSIRDGIREGLSGVRCLTFNVITGYGSETHGRRHLRLVGQIAAQQPPGKLILQGFSYEVPETFTDMAFEQDAARVDDVLRGVMDLSNEPMAVLDPHSLEVLMTSPAWRRQDFGHVGGFGDVLAEDPEQLRKFIEEAVDDGDRAQRSRTIQLRHTDGSIRPAQITVTSVRASRGEGSDVIVKMEL